MEDDLLWKTTFGGRQPLVEDNLQWKTTFFGRQPLIEDDRQWKTTFGGRQLLVEDNPCMLPSLLCGIVIYRLELHKYCGRLQNIRRNLKN